MRRGLIAIISFIIFLSGGIDLKAQQEFNEDKNLILILTKRIMVPYGNSTFTHILKKPLKVNPLDIGYVMTGQCSYAPETIVEVQLNQAGVWHATTWKEDAPFYFYHSGTYIYGLKFSFNQTKYAKEVCELRVYGHLNQTPGSDPEPSPGKKIFAGLAGFEGGFGERMEFTLNKVFYATEFMVKIPRYCEVEILDAGAVEEGHYIGAKLIDEDNMIFSFSDNVVLENIVLTLIGPREQHCDLPIYVLYR